MAGRLLDGFDAADDASLELFLCRHLVICPKDKEQHLIRLVVDSFQPRAVAIILRHPNNHHHVQRTMADGALPAVHLRRRSARATTGPRARSMRRRFATQALGPLRRTAAERRRPPAESQACYSRRQSRPRFHPPEKPKADALPMSFRAVNDSSTIARMTSLRAVCDVPDALHGASGALTIAAPKNNVPQSILPFATDH